MQIIKTHIFIVSTRKTYVKIDREAGSDEVFPMLDEVNSDLEDDIDNLVNNSSTKFVLEESLEMN